MDHCGQAGVFAKELGVPIEGPDEDDRFWIERLGEDGARFGMSGKPFEADRWLNDGDTVTGGALTQIGRAHVRTPVTNAHLVNRLLLGKKKLDQTTHSQT